MPWKGRKTVELCVTQPGDSLVPLGCIGDTTHRIVKTGNPLILGALKHSTTTSEGAKAEHTVSSSDSSDPAAALRALYYSGDIRAVEIGE